MSGCHSWETSMCDNDSINDIIEYNRRTGLSRREFGALTLGAGLVSALPVAAATVATTESEVAIKTPDGTADAYFVHPAKGVHPAEGAHPGVLIWPDIFGLR